MDVCSVMSQEWKVLNIWKDKPWHHKYSKLISFHGVAWYLLHCEALRVLTLKSKGYLFWWNQVIKVYEWRHLGMENMLVIKFGWKPGATNCTIAHALKGNPEWDVFWFLRAVHNTLTPVYLNCKPIRQLSQPNQSQLSLYIILFWCHHTHHESVY